MNNLYVFVEKEKCDDCVKYGMKLSEYSNKIISCEDIDRKGIQAFLSPKDSNLYLNPNYCCLRINVNLLNVYIYNQALENTDMIKKFIVKLSDYVLGSFEDPIALITSTILPENISIYNETLDVPLIIENSKEFYYKKSILELIENEDFSNYEIYQVLLLLGEKKQALNIKKCSDNLRIYVDSKHNKQYTRKGNF